MTNTEKLAKLQQKAKMAQYAADGCLQANRLVAYQKAQAKADALVAEVAQLKRQMGMV